MLWCLCEFHVCSSNQASKKKKQVFSKRKAKHQYSCYKTHLLDLWYASGMWMTLWGLRGLLALDLRFPGLGLPCCVMGAVVLEAVTRVWTQESVCADSVIQRKKCHLTKQMLWRGFPSQLQALDVQLLLLAMEWAWVFVLFPYFETWNLPYLCTTDWNHFFICQCEFNMSIFLGHRCILLAQMDMWMSLHT